MNQLELHKKIDDFVKKDPKKTTAKDLNGLIGENQDGWLYFYFKVADERWVDWLWENKFFEVLKKKAESLSGHSYKNPELGYLARIAESGKEPDEVLKVILGVPISEKTFNPEVVDVFLRIGSYLPAKQIARLVDKIKKEEWIKLMSPYNRWGFEYEKMLKKLIDEKDYKNALVLARTILEVKTKEEMKKSSKGFSDGKSFYLDDLSYTKIFEYLIGMPYEYREEALEITATALGKLAESTSRDDHHEAFKVSDGYVFFGIDFFDLTLGENDTSDRDNVQSLAATVKSLALDLISKCDENAKKIYRDHIETLPDCESMWHLKLFVLSLCPVAFGEELKKAFWRVFDKDDKYHEFLSGREYYKTLEDSFIALSEADQRSYVNEVYNYFGKKRKDKKSEEYAKQVGLNILACIYIELTDDETKKAKDVLGEDIDINFEPKAYETPVVRSVHPKAPIDIARLGDMKIPDIVKKLEKEWDPKKLYEQESTNRDFYNPLNADGMGYLLKQDIANRFKDYMDSAVLFFDKENLNAHYTYSFFQGVMDVLREGKYQKGTGIEKLFDLFEAIEKSSKKEPLDDKEKRSRDYGSWLAGWNAVHSAMADILEKMMGDGRADPLIDFGDYRPRLLGAIKYLLGHSDPGIKSNENDKDAGADPFTVAINSVRGKAFQAFAMFSFLDGKKINSGIEQGLKDIYEEVLGKEKTYALFFEFGYYLSSFYYREPKFIIDLLPKIFPEDKDLFMAAFEGYLANNLYAEIFNEPEFGKLYKRAVEIDPEQYTKRRYFRDFDEGLATHLALAFVYFKDFKIGSPLFDLFWNTQNIKRQKTFVSFMGKHVISKEEADEPSNDKKIDREKVKKFWDWALENKNIDKEVFEEFGFWMNAKKHNIFNDNKELAKRIIETLKRSGGYLSWDYGLKQSLSDLAQSVPKETLEVLREFLLTRYKAPKTDLPASRRDIFYLDEEIYNVFDILYNSPNTRADTEGLINALLPCGNGIFWKLEEIIK